MRSITDIVSGSFCNTLYAVYLVLTCITLKVSALCILLSTAFRSISKFSPKIFPALVISVTMRRPTNVAVYSEDEGFSSSAAT
jgi:hypothetical protein